MSTPLLIIFQLIVLIFSVMIHEISHGAVALKLGDQTAKRAGRLTLNPLRHLDPIGSFLLPLFLFLLGGPIFGWAKPVPYNPMNLRNPKAGAGLIGAAGPLSNILLAIVFGLFIRGLSSGTGTEATAVLITLLQMIVLINIALAIFNLIPIPPLDGSNILFALLPGRYYPIYQFLIRYGFYIIIFLIFFGGFNFIVPIIRGLYNLIVGSSLVF